MYLLLQLCLIALAIFLQDFGDARLTATHQFTITVVDVPAKVPIFLHTERYHFRTPEVVDGGDPISCSSPRIIGNVLAVDGDDLVESGISYSITGCKLSLHKKLQWQ